MITILTRRQFTFLFHWGPFRSKKYGQRRRRSGYPTEEQCCSTVSTRSNALVWERLTAGEVPHRGDTVRATSSSRTKLAAARKKEVRGWFPTSQRHRVLVENPESGESRNQYNINLFGSELLPGHIKSHPNQREQSNTPCALSRDRPLPTGLRILVARHAPVPRRSTSPVQHGEIWGLGGL